MDNFSTSAIPYFNVFQNFGISCCQSMHDNVLFLSWKALLSSNYIPASEVKDTHILKAQSPFWQHEPCPAHLWSLALAYAPCSSTQATLFCCLPAPNFSQHLEFLQHQPSKLFKISCLLSLYHPLDNTQNVWVLFSITIWHQGDWSNKRFFLRNRLSSFLMYHPPWIFQIKLSHSTEFFHWP